jgi:hypothetical protein
MVPSLVIGLIVACDPGLLDTVRSGAEGYLAGVWIGAMMLGLGARWRWAPAWSLACFAMALMHHPLAVCALPLLWGLSWRSRATWVGLGLAAAMLAPRVLRGMREALPTGAGQGDPLEALPAYLGQGEAIAVLVLAGPLIGLVSPRTRATALRTLVAAAIMLALGLVSGYLRDHHLRILTVPALLGWSAVPWPASVLAGLLILAPSQREAAAEVMDRPGTVGLTQQVSAVILAEVEPPLVVDGAWLSGGPVASPAGVLLDLHLRGRGASSLRPGGAVVVVVSAEREARAGVSSGALRRLELGQALLLVGTESDVRTWSLDHCEARLGGAWDALSVLHPQITVDRTRDWWACP